MDTAIFARLDSRERARLSRCQEPAGMDSMQACLSRTLSSSYYLPCISTRTSPLRRKPSPIWSSIALGSRFCTSRGVRFGGWESIAELTRSFGSVSSRDRVFVCKAALKEETERSMAVGKALAGSAVDLMVVSDLDGTMVDHKDNSHKALLRFNNLWAAEYAHKSLLVFSTGRSPEKYEELRKQVPLLTPDVGIFSVGTEIRYGRSLEPDEGWERFLDDGWDHDLVLAEVKKLKLRLQDESEQRPHKVSCQIDHKDAPRILEALSSRLNDHGLKIKLIYSHSLDIDVLPQGAGKGEALAYLQKKMKSEGWAPQNVLVCGDSGNDVELFEVEGVNGVIVGGAMEELLEWYEKKGEQNNKIVRATERCAGGIVQALGNFKLGPHLSPRDRMGPDGIQPLVTVSENGKPVGSGFAQREVVEFNTFFEKWMNGEVPNSAEAFQRLTGVIAPGSTMVYPWGVEQDLYESVSSAQSKHGMLKDKEFRTWIDCIQEQKLAEGVFMVTWHSWQMSAGAEQTGYFATAIFRTKAGLPNGVQWVRVHETPQKP